MSSMAGRLPHEPDSEGCLLLVASYADAASFTGLVASTARDQIMTAPALADFVELRFIDLGPRPAHGGRSATATRCLGRELTRPASGVDSNYFALVIVDGSAAAVQQLLAEADADPVIAQLPIRYQGFGSAEDREPEAVAGPPVVISPGGTWFPEDLTDRLRRYAEDLMQDFATWSQPGLTHVELGPLQRDTEDLPVPSEPPVPVEPPVPAEPPVYGSEADEGAAHAPDAGPAPAAYEPIMRAGPGLVVVAPRHPADEAAPRPSRRPHSPEHEEPVSPKDPREGPGRARRRWIPEFRRPGRRAPDPADSTTMDRTAGEAPAMATAPARPPAGPPKISPEADPRPRGLVYLILTSDEHSASGVAWRRGRAMLIELDGKLAEAADTAYLVRALQQPEDMPRGELQPAGKLRRGSFRQRSEGNDLGQVLTAVLTTLRRDLAALGRDGAALLRPAIVLFVADAPLNDAVTASAYEEAAQEAAITWVVHESAMGLLSRDFEGAGGRVLADHQAVADEVLTTLPRGQQAAAD
jgi:hypothetical protein